MLSKLRQSVKGKDKEVLSSSSFSIESIRTPHRDGLDTPSSSSYSGSPSSSSESTSSAASTSHYLFPRLLPPLTTDDDEKLALHLQLIEENRHRDLLLSDEALVHALLAAEAEEERKRDDEELDLLRLAVEEERREEQEKEKREEQEWKDLVEKEAEESLKRTNGTVECEVCYGEFYRGEIMVQCPEGHILCSECATSGAAVAFSMLDARLPCLVSGTCETSYPPEECRKFLDKKQWAQFEKLRLAADMAVVEGVVMCPFCPYGVIFDDPDYEILDCLNPDCLKRSCVKCKNLTHPNETCAQANPTPTQRLEEAMSKEMIRQCPKCDKKFVKTGGCNMITCAGQECRAKSCYICKKLVGDYNHFSLPGPCNGLLYKDGSVIERVEQVRLAQIKELATEDEKKHAEKLKIKR